MIKEKTVSVRWCYQNKQHYVDLGYEFTKYGDYFEAKVEHLTDGSNIKITAICDVCGKETLLKYQIYMNSYKNGNYYSCNECSREKQRKTCLDRYGSETPFGSKEIIEKRKKTCLRKYGTTNYLASEEGKAIIKKTCREKYGVDNIFQKTEYIQSKMIEKYGVDHYFKTQEGKEKYLYGENNPSYNSELTDEERVFKRESVEDRKWRKSVYERDNYTCICCGYDKGRILNAHHLNSHARFPEQRYDVNNGVTLCKHCHREFHNKYGYKNFTKEQFNLFLEEHKEAASTIP